MELTALAIGTNKRQINLCIGPCKECFILDGDHLCADHGSHTTSKEQTCQADNEWLDLQIRNQEALYNTESQTDNQCNSNRCISTHAVILHLIGHNHTN